MTLPRLDPPTLRRAVHFSQAVVVPAGRAMLFLAGQIAGDDLAALAAMDIGAQLHATFDRIEMILQNGGMSIADLVKVTGFITDRSHVVPYRAIFLQRLGGIRPASTLVIATLVDPRILVEIEAVASR